MNAIDRRIEELQKYRPDLTAEPDLGLFWDNTIQLVHANDFRFSRKTRPTLLANAEAWDVVFAGFDDMDVHGLFMKPASVDGPCPCAIIFAGYTAGKEDPEQYAKWISMGIAVFAVDARGQGGTTGNTLGSEHGMAKGWVTQGILDLDRCYYRAMAVDNMRAARWALAQADIDPSRIGVMGMSQGGGTALLVSAFFPELRFIAADVPNLCHMDYGVLHSTGSLTEIADFCRRFSEHTSVVLRHLSYFDLLNLADRIRMPVLMSVGLKDTICMPETIFPVYDRIASANKRLEIYPFTGHAVEAGQRRKAQAFVMEQFDLGTSQV